MREDDSPNLEGPLYLAQQRLAEAEAQIDRLSAEIARLTDAYLAETRMSKDKDALIAAMQTELRQICALFGPAHDEIPSQRWGCGA